MNAQTSGFRAACREQAGLAWSVFARFMGRYAPSGRGRIVLRTGCLVFAPFITLTVWLLQAVVWLMVGTPHRLARAWLSTLARTRERSLAGCRQLEVRTVRPGAAETPHSSLRR